MSLNRFMHPRNRYKSSPPDFAKLAADYPSFREHVEMNLNGKVTLDFKNPEALRALTCTLLKEDYGLDVHLPLDRLVPTVPLRLNYIHWIEDLIQQDGNYKGSNIHGIDIGTGASCIYPLLGEVVNDWKFTATETDDLNIKYATENIERNEKNDKIKVIKTSEDCLLRTVLEGDPKQCYTFCMCNPPFYGSPLEAQGLLSRSEDRPDPKSINTAADTECIAEGGEVTFVKKIIADSLKYRDRVRWYTSMVGKKKSIWPLKTELKKHKVRTVTTTEFCQGRTMRWGIAWTFTEDDSSLPLSPLKKFKTEKEKPQMKIQVPETFVRNAVERLRITEAIQKKPPATRLLAVQREVEKMMTELQIQYKLLNNKVEIKFELTAFQNTWSNQRRKRREAMRKELKAAQATPGKPCDDVEMTADGEKKDGNEGSAQRKDGKVETAAYMERKANDNEETTADEKKDVERKNEIDNCEKKDGGADIEQSLATCQYHTAEPNHVTEQGKSSNSMTTCVLSCDNSRDLEERTDHPMEAAESTGNHSASAGSSNGATHCHLVAAKSTGNHSASGSTAGDVCQSTQQSTEESTGSDCEPPLLKCLLMIKNINKEVVIEMVFIEGKHRDLLHQIAQYFRNQFPKRIQLSPSR
ncbi:RNA N(6)-adenosine-methyltransferase mettl16-like [Glandiceps talaboti]